MTKGAFRRWMYRGHHPNWLGRLFNREAVVLSSLGFFARFGLATLEVTGRTSGRIVSLPVAVLAFAGERYLVSMLGEDVQWVKNVRAVGGRAAIRGRRREEVQLEAVPVEQRAPILKAYLRRAPGARPHVPVDKDAPLAAFERIAGAYPVFRLTAPRLESTARADAAQRAKAPDVEE